MAYHRDAGPGASQAKPRHATPQARRDDVRKHVQHRHGTRRAAFTARPPSPESRKLRLPRVGKGVLHAGERYPSCPAKWTKDRAPSNIGRGTRQASQLGGARPRRDRRPYGASNSPADVQNSPRPAKEDYRGIAADLYRH
jgi:hypothetical protein